MTRKEFLEKLKIHIEQDLRQERMWSIYKKEVLATKENEIGQLLEYWVYECMGADNAKDAAEMAATLLISMFLPDFTWNEYIGVAK